ncbi:GNAT family N-acetyltransferase [Aeromonas rivipollensis]|uniref:GNAT family N-acetyltransferase n=1 Tax=Aeromonas rivipollensis TaxID=948519 RepID=A0ABX0CZ45_9GAMM|nr:GNAT family N-acetyltransferase [Aeromonas rivipollensis]NEX87986.1 GNAT family N-acetyltransferase [Aeromonas rivipollensis]NEY05897.1 GNAT family N-acetyltransferase [Aeromonas rivipollensis]
MQIHQATSVDIDDLTLLFDAYRQFYGQAPAPMAAAAFIAERLAKSESVIFLARGETGEAIGFAQLYPAFSSVAMKRMWYLNDLFVAASARQQGVARALLKQVATFARETDALTVKLATAVSNLPAKALYESEGYQKVVAFDHYTQGV